MGNLVCSSPPLKKQTNKYVELNLALDEANICALDHIYLLISVSW